MTQALCPYCKRDLYGLRLRKVYTHYITMYDQLSGQSQEIKRDEYECPQCGGWIVVTNGRLSTVPKYDVKDYEADIPPENRFKMLHQNEWLPPEDER